jgi:type II secretory pathway component PulF
LAGQYLFLEAWGQILSVGVPILRSIDVITEMLPLKDRVSLAEARDAIANGRPLDAARFSMLPGFAVAMIDRGEAEGALDTALLKAAEALMVEFDTIFE